MSIIFQKRTLSGKYKEAYIFEWLIKHVVKLLKIEPEDVLILCKYKRKTNRRG